LNAVSNPCPFKVPGFWHIAAATCARLVGHKTESTNRITWRDDLIARAIAAIRTGQAEQSAQLLAYHQDALANDPAYLNLAGVFAELQEDCEAARRFYGLAIAIDPRHAPSQQNMRRMFELMRFGHTTEQVALGDEDALPVVPGDGRCLVSELRAAQRGDPAYVLNQC
jgi:tetratricopeptide (TPR) repeat protein